MDRAVEDEERGENESHATPRAWPVPCYVDEAMRRVVTALMLVQSLSGLLFPNLYRDPLWIRYAWKGNDLVTLVFVVPVLAFAIARPREPRFRAWTRGLFAYGVYNYAYYLFGASLNAFFPLYVVLFASSIVALARSMLDREEIEVRSSIGIKIASGTLIVTGIALLLVWIAQWVKYVFYGQSIDAGPDVMRLIAALDCSVMVPALVAGGVLLWRRQSFGLVLAPAASIMSATYMFVLFAGTLFAARAGIPGMASQLPLWGALVIVLGITTALLLHEPALSLRPAPSR